MAAPPWEHPLVADAIIDWQLVSLGALIQRSRLLAPAHLHSWRPSTVPTFLHEDVSK